MATDLIGRVVGNYRVVSKLGEGGMGVVFLAEHPVIGKRVALKVLHSDLARNPEVIARFFNEARAVNLIGHPNIVDVIDLGHTEDGAPYFTMEFLLGESLAERIQRTGSLEVVESVRIADQVLDAVAAAHAKGIVHRDMKPENVFLLERGGRTRVKVLDFGIAKLQDAGALARTITGSVMGTPLYMSAEQCRGAGQVDHRTDLYSFAVVLFEMLAGRPVFVGDSFGDLIRQHLLEPPVPVRTLRPEVPVELEAAILRALEKEPEQRFSSAAEMREAILASVGEQAAASSSLLPTPRPVGVRPPAYTTGVASPTPTHVTTLTGSPLDDDDDDLTVPRRSAAGKVVLVGILAAAAAAAFVVIGRPFDGGPAAAPSTTSSSSAPPAEPAIPSQPAPPARPAGETAAPVAPVPTPVVAAAAQPPAAEPQDSKKAVKDDAKDDVKIVIVSEPGGARVTVEGRPQGETPVTIEIPRGESRQVEIAMPGMRTERLKLTGDRARTERVTLRERAARSKAAPIPIDPDGEVRPSWMK